MNEEKPINFLFAFVVVFGILSCGLVLYVGMFTIQMIGITGQVSNITINRVVKKSCPVACVPCVDEPIFEKCSFNSLSYKVLDNRYDIYGNKELNKGDIYILRNAVFNNDFVRFCNSQLEKNDDCYSFEAMLNNKLFKPIN
jgi:hypothetical protein